MHNWFERSVKLNIRDDFHSIMWNGNGIFISAQNSWPLPIRDWKFGISADFPCMCATIRSNTDMFHFHFKLNCSKILNKSFALLEDLRAGEGDGWIILAKRPEGPSWNWVSRRQIQLTGLSLFLARSVSRSFVISSSRSDRSCLDR